MTKIHIAGTQNLDVQDPKDQIVVGNYQVDPNAQEGLDSESHEVLTTESFAQDYDKVSIPDELFSEQSDGDENTKLAETTQSTETADEESTEDVETKEQSEQAETVSSDPSDESFVYESEDGSKYSKSDIEGWKKDSDNRHDWNKSNTEKAQTVADQRRAIEPMVQLIAKLKESEEFSETIIEAVEDELGKDVGQLLKQSLEGDIDGIPNPLADELKEANDKLAQMEAQRALDASMAELKSTYELSDEDAQKVLDFAIEKHEKDGRLLTLDEAYKVMNFDQPKPKEEKPKKKPSIPVSVKKDVGVKSDVKNKPQSYDAVDISSFFNR